MEAPNEVESYRPGKKAPVTLFINRRKVVRNSRGPLAPVHCSLSASLTGHSTQ